MNVNFNTEIDTESLEFKNFLLKAKRDEKFTFLPDPPVGYEVDDKREGSIRGKDELFTYAVKENWKMYEDCSSSGTGQLVGIHTPIMLEQRHISYSTNFVLFLKSGISNNSAAHARSLLKRFAVETELTTEAEIINWIGANIGSELKPDDFILQTEAVAEAVEDLDNVNPFDISQREFLFDLYENRNRNSRLPVIHENDEGGLGEWAQNRRICWKLGRRSAVLGDGEPTNTSAVQHLPNGKDPESYDPRTMINDIVDSYMEPDCLGMKTYKEKLLIIGEWPEFKIEWVMKTIKVGCCRIKTKLPVAYKRIGKLVFYGYYRIPENLGRAILKIAESCLIKTALKSAIIGIITSNIAAAIKVFVPLYKECLIEEAKECIYPGLLLLKESNQWKRI